MATKNIEIRDDLYKRLNEIKENNEDFSDLIERLLEEGQKGSSAWVKRYFGIWNDMPEEFFEMLNNARSKFEEEMSSRLIQIRND